MYKGFESKNYGITLIALVVSIVILLILAGVTISMLTGNNGILVQTINAKELTTYTSTRESLQLALIRSMTKNGDIDMGLLNSSLKDLGFEEDDISFLPTFVTLNKYKFIITNNGTIYDAISMEDAQSDYMLNKDSNSRTIDNYGNIIVIPSNFKITADTTLVTEGIVIEDNEGNQFVWIPVGKIYTNEERTSYEEIELSRYEFASGINEYADNEGNNLGILPRGTPINRGENGITDQAYSGRMHYELEVGTNNAATYNLNYFLNYTKSNGGYYLGRYEASYGIDGKPNSKVSTNYSDSDEPSNEGDLWNFISQLDASSSCQNMYSSKNYISDLVNSYAWDTALLFIQKFSTNYEYPVSNIAWVNNYKLNNTGGIGEKSQKFDCVLNIFDMATNLSEWNTESFMQAGYDWNICPIYMGDYLYRWSTFF